MNQIGIKLVDAIGLPIKEATCDVCKSMMEIAWNEAKCITLDKDSLD